MHKKDKELNHDIGLFIIRLAIGSVFILHAFGKLGNLSGTVGFFERLDLAPAFAYIVLWVEMAGGLALIVGLFTKIAGVALAVVMLSAIAFVRIRSGFIGGYEFEFVVMVVCLALAYTGSGRIALHRLGELKRALNEDSGRHSWKDIIRSQM